MRIGEPQTLLMRIGEPQTLLMRIREPQTLLMRIGEPQGDTRPDGTTKWANSAQNLAATWSWSGLG